MLILLLVLLLLFGGGGGYYGYSRWGAGGGLGGRRDGGLDCGDFVFLRPCTVTPIGFSAKPDLGQRLYGEPQPGMGEVSRNVFSRARSQPT